MIMAALSGSAMADAATLTALLLPMMVAAGRPRSIRRADRVSRHHCADHSAEHRLRDLRCDRRMCPYQTLHGWHCSGHLAGAGAVGYRGGLVRGKVRAAAAAIQNEVFKAFREATWALVLPFIIVFGLQVWHLPPTEAAVVAAVYAIFVSLVVYRELSFRRLVAVVCYCSYDLRCGDVSGCCGNGFGVADHCRQPAGTAG